MDVKIQQNIESPKIQCVGCLNDISDRNFQYYNIQNEPLKIIFRDNKLLLCCLCKKMFENIEYCIQHVLNNKILGDYKSFSDEAGEIVNTQTSLCSLSVKSLEFIELTGFDTQVVEPFIVYKYGIYKECETKEKEVFLNDDRDNCMDDEMDVDDNTKEKSYEMENNVDSTDLCIDVLNSDLKNNTIRKKKRDAIDFIKIQRLHITKSQCMEERNKKAREKKFLAFTYKCMDCIKGFTYKPSYEKHLQLHCKDNGDYECEICKLRMDSEEKLLRHKRFHKVRYKCSACGIIRTNKSTVKDHYESTHTNGIDVFICKLCCKVFRCRRRLTKHTNNTHKGKVICAHCMKTYANKDVLKAHLVRSHPSEVAVADVKKEYVCLECGKAFKAPSLLKIHSNKHTMEKKFYCVECDKSFKHESGLKQHFKSTAQHAAPDSLPVACSKCDKKFAIRRALEQHMNRVHLNIRPFKCDQCDKAYVSSSSLKEHRKLAHEGYKRPMIFSCPVCDRVFDRKSILTSHIRTHTGERPFQCSICSAKFSQSGILGTHMKHVHQKRRETEA